MLKSILTTALRNILRNRSFSIINMLGLSVSMSLALLIILIVREQYSYDNFHHDADKIYRVNTRAIRVEGGSEDYASAPLPIGRAIKEEFSFAEHVVRINRRLSGDIVYGNVNVPIAGFFTDPSFMQVFNFPLEKGDPATALKEPNSLVITQEAAHKIFGQQEPLGQTITLSGYGEFVVTGLLAKLPGKTHFEFEVLASTAAMPQFEQRGIINPSLDNWNNYYSNYVYFKLREGKSRREAEDALSTINKKYYSGLKLETRDKNYEFFLMSLGEITPGPEMSNQMGSAIPTEVIYFLVTLVSIVMVMACFNYTNLTIAKSLSRAREIGIRKVVGAKRLQVFIQFTGETIVFSLICLAFSYVLMQFLKPAFMQLNIANEFSADLQEDFSLYFIFFAFAVCVGIIAGLLPAGYLSALQPLKVLKDSGNLKLHSKLTFRKILIGVQFTFSLVFIIVVLVVYEQINYMVNKDYGFHEKDILNVRLQGVDFEKLAQEMKSLPGVVAVGGVSHRLGTWADRSSDYKRNREDEPFVMRDFMADANYITNLELIFVNGNNFDQAEDPERERDVILNEKALKLFGFADAPSAVGHSIFVDDSVMLTVVGVVKDFHFRPLNYEIGPLAFRYKKNEFDLLSARIVPDQKEKVAAAIVSIWKKFDPIHPVEWMMMEDEIDKAYSEAGFLDILKIVGYISFLSISLACLGMLGMAMYSTQTRIKEIGVRKVMGASTSQIVTLLSHSFLLLLCIAALIGTPIGYFFGEQFLSSYAYKIPITPLLILTGVLIVGFLGILIIGTQTWRAARRNPVKSLRYE
jgi:putative ABC transport system permease protein